MLPFRFSLPKFLFGVESRPIDLPSVQIQDLERGTDRRTRTLKHLIKANHANFSVIYHNLRFDNHMDHVRIPLVFILDIRGPLVSLNPQECKKSYLMETKFLDPRFGLLFQFNARTSQQNLWCGEQASRTVARCAKRDFKGRLEGLFGQKRVRLIFDLGEAN